MRKRNTLKTFGLALLSVGLLTLLAALGVLDALDNTASDALYQSRSASDGEIILIGIDDRAIDELGGGGRRAVRQRGHRLRGSVWLCLPGGRGGRLLSG